MEKKKGGGKKLFKMQVCPYQFKSFNIQRPVKQNISTLRLHQLSEVSNTFIRNIANFRIKVHISN